MSDSNNNNNNNNNAEESNSGDNNSNNNNDRSNNYRNNRNNRNYNDNNNEDKDKVKGACKELGCGVFDCTSRKQMEACDDTLKAMAMHAGTGKEHGKQADLIKFTVEKEKEPTKELKEPKDINKKHLSDQVKLCKVLPC